MRAIVCVDAAWAIGCAGRMLFHLPGDLRYFREQTTGGTVIMGRKTLESLPGGRPLPGRRNIVLTRGSLTAEGVETAHSIEEAVCLAQRAAEPVWVIGGGSVYRALLDRCEAVYVTRVEQTAAAAETYFPDLDADSRWEMTEKSELQHENGLDYRFCIYRAKPAAESAGE